MITVPFHILQWFRNLLFHFIRCSLWDYDAICKYGILQNWFDSDIQRLVFALDASSRWIHCFNDWIQFDWIGGTVGGAYERWNVAFQLQRQNDPALHGRFDIQRVHRRPSIQRLQGSHLFFIWNNPNQSLRIPKILRRYSWAKAWLGYHFKEFQTIVQNTKESREYLTEK